MKKKPWPFICFLCIPLLWATHGQAQNNLAPGDIAIVSYQSDIDPTNVSNGGTTAFHDRFSIIVLKSGGLAAGTVIYFTDNGWNAGTGNFTDFLEGSIKWVVPAGGVAFGTEVYFICSEGTSIVVWAAGIDEPGSALLGTVTSENGNLLLSIAGDQLLAYQTGSPAGPAGTYNNTTRRFITAIHANVEANTTTYTAWDGANPTSGNQSSLPPGLTNGVNAFLLSQATLPTTTPLSAEFDNGKFNCTGAAHCNAVDICAAINTITNWTLSPDVFSVNTSSSHCIFTDQSFSLPTSKISDTRDVTTGNNLFHNQSCEIISNIVPSGFHPVTGPVTCQVWVESAVPTFSNQPFVERHYEITPALSPGVASAIVTLYFSQTEFDAFNAAPGSMLDLPAHPSDNIGKANLRVGKYAGSSNNGSGLPGSYSGGVVVINPDDADIVWNTVDSRWEVTFETTGFSGFIVQTAIFALPVNLTSFSAQPNGNDIHLQWKTTGEIDHDYFDVERSIDGISYSAVARLRGNNGNTIQNYAWIDQGAAQMNVSKIYYRLKMVSTSGMTEYSYFVMVPVKKPTVSIMEIVPNPFIDKLNIHIYMPDKTRIGFRLTDITGKILKSEYVNAPKGSTTHSITGIHTLAQGIYFLVAEYNGQVFSYKVVK